MDINKFTRRERDAITLLLQGKSNNEIALELHISVRTVEFHLNNIFTKLEVNSRTEAVLELVNSPGMHTAGIPEESTVDQDQENPDNDGNPMPDRRIPVKKSSFFFTLGLSLLITIVIVVILFTTKPKITQPTPLAESVTPQENTATAASTPIATATRLPEETLLPTSVAANPPATFQGDAVLFLDETYPDGTTVANGETFTKTWTVKNVGTTTWTEDYALVNTEGSYPLGESSGHPPVISIPYQVQPGETIAISVNITAPQTDCRYEIHYKFKNANGDFFSEDINDVWFKVVVGQPQIVGNTVSSSGITMELIQVQKENNKTTAEVCAQWPDTQDWIPGNVKLFAGNTQADLSGYLLKNPKSPETFASTYRCFFLEFLTGAAEYASEPVTISIGKVFIPTNLSNCPDVRTHLIEQYPGLDFTCGPMGFFYSNLKLPANMSKNAADLIIMDALDQVNYGDWVLSE